MALQKRSRLHQVHLTFDEDGVYVTGDALFQEGAWDTDLQGWEGKPVAREYPVHNMDPAGKKFLNDVIGVAATKALETAAVAAEAMKKAAHDADTLSALAGKAQAELKDALGARDNFAALHKEEKGHKMQLRAERDVALDNARDSEVKLERVPRLIRKMFGAA